MSWSESKVRRGAGGKFAEKPAAAEASGVHLDSSDDESSPKSQEYAALARRLMNFDPDDRAAVYFEIQRTGNVPLPDGTSTKVDDPARLMRWMEHYEEME